MTQPTEAAIRKACETTTPAEALLAAIEKARTDHG